MGTMGSTGYMAPEQIKKTSMGQTVDVYGLGCTLFALLSGKRPDSDQGDFLDEKRQLNSKYREIILKATERKVEKRYQNAHELRTAIQNLKGKGRLWKGVQSKKKLDGTGEVKRAWTEKKADDRIERQKYFEKNFVSAFPEVLIDRYRLSESNHLVKTLIFRMCTLGFWREMDYYVVKWHDHIDGGVPGICVGHRPNKKGRKVFAIYWTRTGIVVSIRKFAMTDSPNWSGTTVSPWIQHPLNTPEDLNVISAMICSEECIQYLNNNYGSHFSKRAARRPIHYLYPF